VCYDADFYPYGGERPYTNNCTTHYKFEGKERDEETGNDAFGARYYSNRFGRWLSADWSAVPVAVPYANLSNPQTLNLYSMVGDDPESFADLNGHCVRTLTGYAACDTTDSTHEKQQQQSPYQKFVEQQNAPVSDADRLNTLKQAGAIAEPAINAALVVGAVEAALSLERLAWKPPQQ
jgi:RHS repeat-associated protein